MIHEVRLPAVIGRSAGVMHGASGAEKATKPVGDAPCITIVSSLADRGDARCITRV